MPNPFQVSGAATEKPSKYAPILVKRFWSGQYSNSNPLAEATVPYLYSRFYSASRYEVIRSGSNVEISPRLTIIRRPGLSPYNTQTFPPCTTFYSFRVFDPYALVPSIRVIADTATAVYDATGPSTKTLLWTKLAGAGQTSFQSVGNTLYAADGISNWKWVWAPSWTANFTYSFGDFIIDTNGNLQAVSGVSLINNPIISVQIAADTGNIVWNGPFIGNQVAELQGQFVNFAGFVGASFLNGQSLLINQAYTDSFGHATIVFSFSHSNYGPAFDTGIVTGPSGSSQSGSSVPSWSNTIGGETADNQLVWSNKGSAVESWGIIAPLAAPQVSNSFSPAGNAWAASTYFWPVPVIVDPNSNIQLLTTAGTTANSVPSFNVSGTTTDGTAVWTFQGAAARATTTSYALGSFIAVTVTTTVTIKIPVSEGRTFTYTYETVSYSNFYVFQASVGGTSSSTATASIVWPTALNSTVVDGTVTWQNVGHQVTRTSSSSASPSYNTKGNLSNTTAVQTYNSIVDNVSSGGGTGFTQNVVIAGKSGSTHPTWTTNGSSVEQAGLLTIETGGLTWQNGGPNGAANTGSWIYGYAFKNSITGHVSSMSPASAPILLAAQSAISVGGNGDPNWQTDGVDTIVIYRSVQGFSTPFQLTTIPAPANGAPWSYIDVSPDPPNPSSILNEFIEADTVGNNAPPPTGLKNLTYYLNRVFGSSSTFQNWSGVSGQAVGIGAESWPGSNEWQLPEIVTVSWPSASGLLLFLTYGVFLSQGIDINGNPLQPTQILEDIGLLSPNLFTVNGSLPAILSSDGQLLSLDSGSGITRYSDPIADSANGMGGFSATASYLTWHVNGPDSAFYLGDGSTGWFRLCPTAAPEQGFTWSPKANIVGGIGAIVSVETSPGVKNLLVSSTTSGPILKRDLTTNADNGTAFSANVIIGSLVLAEPRQCAEIQSISTFAVNTNGSQRPTVLAMGGEIAAINGASFETLPAGARAFEPDFLNYPVSVFSDRWYFSDLQQPAYLQHLQLQFTWGATNTPDELLAYGIFGCVRIIE